MFKVGDCVELKSGGPLMTVLEVNLVRGTDRIFSVKTTWFSGGEIREHEFNPDVIKH